MGKIRISANGHEMEAVLEDNVSAGALLEMLGEGPVTVHMDDYADMEKVGGLGRTLPRCDRRTSVGPGDLVLYLGSNLVVYYGRNSWNFTLLGHIEGVSARDLRVALGDGSVDVTLSLAD